MVTGYERAPLLQWTCSICGGKTDAEFDRCWNCKTSRLAVEGNETSILIVTTPTLQTHRVVEYLGPVFGEVILGANVLRDFFAGLTDLAGGRAASYESVLAEGRLAALNEMRGRAVELGATAVIGLQVDYSTVNNSMMMICCSGTAVYCEQLPGERNAPELREE